MGNRKTIVAGALAAVMIATGPAVQTANYALTVNIGMKTAEAGGWGDFFSGGIGAAIIDAVIVGKTKSMLKHLRKASMQMSYAKIKMAEAMDLDPTRIAAAKQAAIAVGKTGDVVESVKIAARQDISDSELSAGATKLLSLQDQAANDHIVELLHESEAARHAAHKNNAAAVGDAVFVIGGLAKRIHDDPKGLARNLAICLVAAEAAQSLLKEQETQSAQLKSINTMFKEHWDIKDPTPKDIKKAAKNVDKEFGI